MASDDSTEARTWDSDWWDLPLHQPEFLDAIAEGWDVVAVVPCDGGVRGVRDARVYMRRRTEVSRG